MKIIDIKKSLPKEQQTLFGIPFDIKEGLAKSLTADINLLLRSKRWSLSQAGNIYVRIFISNHTAASTDETRAGFYNKYNNLVRRKTQEAINLTNDLRPYNIYVSLFEWLRLVKTKIDLCMLRANTSHMLLLNIVQSAIRYEHIAPELKNEKTKAYLHSMSLNQFIPNKDEHWQTNIENFSFSARRIKENITEIICYNNTFKFIRELINMKEILLLSEDLTEIVGRVDRLVSYLSNLKGYIEKRGVSSTDSGEKKAKIETVKKLMTIFDDNNNNMISWINKNLNDPQRYPQIYKEGINLAKVIRDDINDRKRK